MLDREQKKMDHGSDTVSVTITLSRSAYDRARAMADDPKGMAGELAGTMTTDEFIERFVEIMLEPNAEER